MDADGPEVLRELLSYDPVTGALTWKRRDRKWFKTEGQFKNWNARYPGTAALSSLTNEGYRAGCVLGNPLLAHRVIWALAHGRWPEFIDHINHDRTDNRIENLRSVSREENARNRLAPRTNTSGRVGVSPCGEKWMAHWRVAGRNVTRRFQSFDAAVAAREQFEEANGYHKNHGKETAAA